MDAGLKSQGVSESRGKPNLKENVLFQFFIDFEKFYQKSILPKELQNINPVLFGADTQNILRALSPVWREPTEQEKDLIKIKYELV